LLATVTTWFTVERLPGRQIQERLAREYDLQLSHRGIIGLLQLVARQSQAPYDQLQADVRASPVVHMDETGWKQDGMPGYIWTASTATTCYFHYEVHRSGAVADALLDPDFAGTITCDFYAAYDDFLYIFPAAHDRATSGIEDVRIPGGAAGDPEGAPAAPYDAGVRMGAAAKRAPQAL
jgi:hypothetical protein